MCDEIRLAVDIYELNKDELWDIISSGFKRSFMPGSYADKRVSFMPGSYADKRVSFMPGSYADKRVCFMPGSYADKRVSFMPGSYADKRVCSLTSVLKHLQPQNQKSVHG